MEGMTRRTAIVGLFALLLPAAPLTQLDPRALATLRDDFNRAAGGVRIILLLSPT